jgi:formylglycine-generating enzyme required for sulfatase activity
VGLAAVLLAVLVSQVALAGDSEKGPRATASAVSASKFKKLKKQVAALQQQVDALARQPGPQGPAGSAPACEGNGSGDTMVAAGAVCIDKYEVSVWSSPTGGTQYGVSTDDYPCDDEGQDCKAGTAGEIYARSVAGVTPSRFITWFQAQQALANSGKRLPSNAEWQQAAAGTPDPGFGGGPADCKVSGGSVPALTGARSDCVSNFGAMDMVGNLSEWVADWFPVQTTCPAWGNPGTFSTDDFSCLGGASTTAAPAALIRGQIFNNDGVGAGPFTATASFSPASTGVDFGFRGAR